MLRNYFFLLLVSFFVCELGMAAKSAEPVVGKPAPDFSLKDNNGKTHKLSEYKGKFVILEWLNHGCPYVKKHYGSGNMQKLQKEMKSKDAVWFSIVSSAPGKQGHMSPEEANKSLTEHKAEPAAILLDTDSAVGKLYAAKTTPHMFLIDPKGLVAYMGAIDDKRSTDVEDIASAKNYVQQAYQQIKTGKAVTDPETQPYGCSVKYP